MPSQLSIINLALTRLGQANIGSLEEVSTEASTAMAIYDTVLRAVLQDHAWAFNTKREALTLLDEDAYGTGFSLVYAIPEDCLQIYEIWNENSCAQRVPFIEENGKIYTNKYNAILVYGAYENLPEKYSPLFIDAFAYRLAAELSIPLSQRSSMFESMMDVYNNIINNAKFKSSTSLVPNYQKPAYIQARS